MKIGAGERITWRGTAYNVIAVQALAVTLRDDNGDEVEVDTDELSKSAEHQTSALGGWRSAPNADEYEGDEELRLWCAALDRLEVAARSHGTLSGAVSLEAERLTGELGKTVSARTVWRKMRVLHEQGPGGLITRGGSTARRRKSSIDARVIEALNAVLASRARASTVTKGAVMDQVADLVRRQHGTDVKMPSRATFYRLLNTEERGRHSFGSAKTRESLSLSPDEAFGRRSVLRPGEHVQIDSTVLDVMVRIDASQVARPELTIMVDVATRSILSAVLRPVGTKSMDLVVVLARAIVPYGRRPEGARETRRLISTAWAGATLTDQEKYERLRLEQPFIFPETITTDNGRAYLSTHFRAVCQRLGISLNTSAPYTPTDKAHVERTFGSISSLFLQYAKGYVGRSVEYRGRDAGTRSDELITIAQMQELLEDWIAVHWQTRAHDGLRDPLEPTLILSPNEMCRAYRKISPELHVPLNRDDFIALLPTVQRRINRYGVTIDHRVYDSKRLKDYRQRQSPVRSKQGKWSIRVDPYNLHVVWLDDNGEFVPLRWANDVHETPMLGEVWRQARLQRRANGASHAEDAAPLVAAMRNFAATGNRTKRSNAVVRAKVVAADPMNLLKVEPAPDELSEFDQLDEIAEDTAWPSSGGFELTSDEMDGVRSRLEGE